MIVLSGFFKIIIFIYSIEILAGFSAFAGIWESGFMRLKIYCWAVGIYESGKLFWLFRTYAENILKHKIEKKADQMLTM